MGVVPKGVSNSPLFSPVAGRWSAAGQVRQPAAKTCVEMVKSRDGLGSAGTKVGNQDGRKAGRGGNDRKKVPRRLRADSSQTPGKLARIPK